jgi:hypothetical protein
MCVEGQTEQWYFEWLAKEINKLTEHKMISINCRVQKDPFKFAKHTDDAANLWCVQDFESLENEDNFRVVIDKMRKAEECLKHKSVKYRFGYSNLAFELWIILHKLDTSNRSDRHSYIKDLNSIFNTNFSRHKGV